MPSLDISTTLPRKNGQPSSSNGIHQPTSKSEVPNDILPSASDRRQPAQMAEFQYPDTLDGCFKLLRKQQKKIKEQREKLCKQDEVLSGLEGKKKLESKRTQRHMREAKDEYELELAEQKQRTREIESQYTIQAEGRAEAESLVKEEREKAKKLCLAYDLVREDLSKQRALFADADESIAQRTGDNLSRLVQSFVENTMKDFRADVDGALHRFKSGGDAFVRNSNNNLRDIQDPPSKPRRRESQERAGESYRNTAEVSPLQRTVAEPLLPNSPTGPRGQKRSSNNTNWQTWKRVKPETWDNRPQHQGEEQRRGAGRAEGSSNAGWGRPTQRVALDPRPQAVARPHSTKAPPLPVPGTTMRSL